MSAHEQRAIQLYGWSLGFAYLVNLQTLSALAVWWEDSRSQLALWVMVTALPACVAAWLVFLRAAWHARRARQRTETTHDQERRSRADPRRD